MLVFEVMVLLEAPRDSSTKIKNMSETQQFYDVFLCGAEFAGKVGNTAAIVDIARSMKAKKILVVNSDGGSQCSITSDMNGKLIHITLPKIAANKSISQNYCLQIIATLCLDDEHMLLLIQKSTVDATCKACCDNRRNGIHQRTNRHWQRSAGKIYP